MAADPFQSEPTREEYEQWMADIDVARRCMEFLSVLTDSLCPWCQGNTLAVQREGTRVVLSCSACCLSPQPSM